VCRVSCERHLREKHSRRRGCRQAGNWLATRNKGRAGLVEGQYRFDISNIEGSFEKEVNLLWRGCGQWLVDNNIRSCAVDNSLQFGLLFGRDRELIQRLLKIVQERLPLLARDLQVLVRFRHRLARIRLFQRRRSRYPAAVCKKET
jgi:hypothetical protein